MRAEYHLSFGLVREQNNNLDLSVNRSHENNIITLCDDAESANAIRAIIYKACDDIDDVLYSRNVPNGLGVK